VLRIIDVAMLEVEKKLKERELTLTLSVKAKEFIATKGFDPQYGARPLRRAIQKYLEDPLAEKILKELVSDGSHVTVEVTGEELEFIESAREITQHEVK
jgi:ATP-dependent Clp protease ATP-binding subunit ClpC